MTCRVFTAGAMFMVWLGQLPTRIRNGCCYSSQVRSIFSTHCDDILRAFLSQLPAL